MNALKLIRLASNVPIIHEGLSLYAKKAQATGTLRGFKAGFVSGAAVAVVAAVGVCVVVACTKNSRSHGECIDEITKEGANR